MHQFRFPLRAQDAVVQHRASGLSLGTQAGTVLRAVEVDAGFGAHVPGLAGAIPVTNALRLVPSFRSSGTTALTHLLLPAVLHLIGPRVMWPAGRWLGRRWEGRHVVG